MTDQELLKAYKEAKAKQFGGSGDTFSEFARRVNKTKELEEMIVIRWVAEQEGRKGD